jgi:hypothetical protein
MWRQPGKGRRERSERTRNEDRTSGRRGLSWNCSFSVQLARRWEGRELVRGIFSETSFAMQGLFEISAVEEADVSNVAGVQAPWRLCFNGN